MIFLRMAIFKIQEIKMQEVKIKKYLKGFALVLVCDIAYDNPCRKHHKTKENPLNKKINYIYNMLASAKYMCLESQLPKSQILFNIHN